VFIDPPYEVIPELAPRLFASVAGWLPPGGDPLLVFETPGELTLADPRWVAVKRIGGTGARQPGVTLFRRAPGLREA
jgi:16S rRNA (guanine966-N2)-methyltransferase